jgi:hypothetical protein
MTVYGSGLKDLDSLFNLACFFVATEFAVAFFIFVVAEFSVCVSISVWLEKWA